MNSMFLTSILISIITIINSQRQINVFIESLCPDSRNFIINSYVPFLRQADNENLGNVTLYPFGNCNMTEVQTRTEFVCQHGPEECFGNNLMTCALNMFERKTAHKFIVCLYSYYELLRPGKMSFEEATFKCDATNARELYYCAKVSDRGNKWQKDMGVATPAHTFIPWVMVDGTYNETVADKIRFDMYGYLNSTKSSN